MGTSSVSSLHQVLEQRLGSILEGVEDLVQREISKGVESEVETRLGIISEQIASEERVRARQEVAAQLNGAMRRLSEIDDASEFATVLAYAAAAFAGGAALFYLENDTVVGGPSRSENPEAFRALRIPIQSSPMLAAAREMKDGFVSAIPLAEIPPALAAAIGGGETRCWVVPVSAGSGVAALLCCWGEAEIPLVETLANIASARWRVLQACEQAGLMVMPAVQRGGPASWDNLPPSEQRVHLRAQRFARVQVAEMRLHNSDAVQLGRSRRDLYAALRAGIDKARESFRSEYFMTCSSMVDYVHLELVHTLANDNPDLLGPQYPGPLV